MRPRAEERRAQNAVSVDEEEGDKERKASDEVSTTALERWPVDLVFARTGISLDRCALSPPFHPPLWSFALHDDALATMVVVVL